MSPAQQSSPAARLSSQLFHPDHNHDRIRCAQKIQTHLDALSSTGATKPPLSLSTQCYCASPFRLAPACRRVCLLPVESWSPHSSRSSALPTYACRRPSQCSSNITLLPLSPFSLTLNPVETLWHYLDSRCWSNREYSDWDDLGDAVCDAWQGICLNRNLIRSVCRVPYIEPRGITSRSVLTFWVLTRAPAIGFPAPEAAHAQQVACMHRSFMT